MAGRVGRVAKEAWCIYLLRVGYLIGSLAFVVIGYLLFRFVWYLLIAVLCCRFWLLICSKVRIRVFTIKSSIQKMQLFFDVFLSLLMAILNDSVTKPKPYCSSHMELVCEKTINFFFYERHARFIKS